MHAKKCSKCFCCFRRLVGPEIEASNLKNGSGRVFNRKKQEKSMESAEFVDLTAETPRASTSTDYQNATFVVNPVFQKDSVDLLDGHGVIVPDPLPTEKSGERHSERSQLFGKAMVAAMTGHQEELRALLKNEPWLLNATDDSGRTLLMFASLCDRIVIARWLLRKGTKAETRDKLDRTALHWAAQKGAHRCLHLLFDWGETMRGESYGGCFVGDTDGVTPIHFAARLNRTKCLQIMLRRLDLSKCKADLASLTDNKGRSPLHWAAASGRTENLRILLENPKLKLNVDMTDDEGRTPLMWAICSRSPTAIECVKLILSKAPWSTGVQDKNGMAPIHLATATGNLAAVKVFFEVGERQELMMDNEFRAPLHWAARLGDKDMVEYFLSKGASVLAKDRWGATPLHYAAQNNWSAVVHTLIEAGIKEDPLDCNGRSSLMWAGVGGAWDCVAKILNLIQPQREHKDKNGATALHLVAQAGKTQVAELLLDRGWSCSTEDTYGLTPLFYAAERGHSDLVTLFLQRSEATGHHDKNGRTVLHWVALGGHGYIMSQLLKQYKLDPDAVDNGGRSSMHCAAFAGFIPCISLLLQAGGDPTLADHSGITPLHLAAQENKLEVASFLLQWECFVNAVATLPPTHSTFDGNFKPESKKLLKTFETEETEGEEGEVEELEEESGSVEETEEVLELVTPLDLALKYDHVDMQLLLLDEGGLTYSMLVTIAATKIQAAYRGFRMRRIYDGVRVGDVSLEIRDECRVAIRINVEEGSPEKSVLISRL